MGLKLRFILAAALATVFLGPATAGPRIKDLVEIEGVRGNDLVGYGLVVGLNGTGDGLRNAPFTEEAIANLLERLGINVTGENLRTRNVAAVLVTATLPPFARAGARIDVAVSAIGDARSLLGGTLIMAPLSAADGDIYAVAQGPILASGVEAGGVAAQEMIGVPTAGTIPNGARVEREVDFVFDDSVQFRLALFDPDFTTAARIERAINKLLRRDVASMSDSGTIVLDPAVADLTPARLMARIEQLEINPASKAKVVIDQRSGTIVLGEHVKISKVAVTQGNLTIRINEEPIAFVPDPFFDAEAIVVPRTEVLIDEERQNRVALIEGNVTLADLVDALNSLGIGPRGMIEILRAIHVAGALHADLIVK
ncbi:MAG: flagellar basal body P-ring protein FlgI [Pseudomonadota bacterium]